MDTSNDWITKRTGVEQRHYCAPGVGSSDLAIQAGAAAMADAGVTADEVDLLVTATMTFLYGLDVADAAIATGRATTVLVIGAESHAGYMPYGGSWDILRGNSTDDPDPADYEMATADRGWCVLFGDGAGAMVLQANPDAPGVLGSELNTDGTLADLIRVKAAGFKNQPWLDQAQITAGMHVPTFNGLELFRQAARRMPEAVRAAAHKAGVDVGDIDVVVAHQANERILDAVRKEMGVGSDIIPSNIARFGNTTAATLPLMFDELYRDGRITSGSLVCFTAFGAGAHWGALLYRHP